MERKSDDLPKLSINVEKTSDSRIDSRILELESENVLLKRILFMMKEDLNVKNEQFDFLFTSLRASDYQLQQEKIQKETQLMAKVKTLENAIREKEHIQRDLESRLIVAHEKLNELSLSRFEFVSTDIMRIIFSYLNHKDLCRSACVSRSWNSLSNHSLHWRQLFRSRYPQLQLSHESSAKAEYQCEYELDMSWRSGRVVSYDEIHGHHGTITGLLAHEDRLVSSSDDGSLCLWDTTSSSSHVSIPPSLGLMTLLDPSSHRKPHPNHMADRIMSFHGHGGPVWCLSCDWSSNVVSSGSYDQTIKIWEMSSGKCTRTLRGHAGWVSALSLSSSNLLSTSWDATIRLWDRDSGVCRRIIDTGVGNAIYCLDARWTNDLLIVAVGCRNNRVEIHDVNRTIQIHSCIGHTRDVYAIKMDGDIIISGSGDNLLKIWDLRLDLPCVSTFRGHTGAVMCLDIDIARFRIVSGSYDKSVRLWDTRMTENAIVAPLHPAAVFAVQATPSRLITGCADNAIRFHNYKSHK